MLLTRATITLWIVATIVVAILPSPTTAHNSVDCIRRCGIGSSSKQVNYPFGFSPSCPIHLNCTKDTGEIRIDIFQVLNITRSSIFINLPTMCNRSISSIKPLFGSNYSPNRTNGLILQNCKTPLKGYFEETRLPKTKFKNCTRNRKGNSVSFFSLDKGRIDVINYEDLNKTLCKYILSSVAMVDGNSLRFEAMQLVWWLKDHSHTCHPNAITEYVVPSDGTRGIRCQCSSGFEGDGFKNGTGCKSGKSRNLGSFSISSQ